ncbi:MAG TPA: quinoprotein dehydrogenase-associated putative ABC transporter substrate-binding protein [Tepidisphaeraceae bacterium]|nr:quinoprotein dehydrogenase-associated putative ABC transporter substrate-binding protein [Tepidisphaeraceae bacterium]
MCSPSRNPRVDIPYAGFGAYSRRPGFFSRRSIRVVGVPPNPARTGVLIVIVIGLIGRSVLASAATTQPLVLRIAADPNNMPFSNDREEGFENRIAKLIADDLGARIEYTWWAQRRGFFRDAIKHGESDVVLGVPAENFQRVLPTRPYYRSTYVFVYRADRGLDIRSFDDPALRKLKIGVPLVGGSSNSPPGQALADRGIIDNIVGFSLYNDYRTSNPAAEMIHAVANGAIDVAVIWGPIGGYFAPRETAAPLKVVPVNAPPELSTPFAYDIAIGIKRGHAELTGRINDILARRRSDIERILDEYGVPRLPIAAATEETSDAKPSSR